MKNTRLIQILVNDEVYQSLLIHINQKMLEEKKHISISGYVRTLIEEKIKDAITI